MCYEMKVCVLLRILILIPDPQWDSIRRWAFRGYLGLDELARVVFP